MSTALLAPPPGSSSVPDYDDGWVLAPDQRASFLDYAKVDIAVNWSEDLEQLHEESTRSHFIDRWTRTAMLARLGPLPGPATVADLGCSTGHLLSELASTRPQLELVGIDLVAGGLRKAHQLVPQARLVRADACALPLLDASVDAILSANLLEHIAADDAALREVTRVLRPGGRAVFVVPAGPSSYDYYDRFLGHERRYARGELAGKVRRAGLEVLENGFIGSLLYPAFWLVKQRNRLLRGKLDGEALERQVATDIAGTEDSAAGEALWRLEERLGLPLPFGIRSLVLARRPA